MKRTVSVPNIRARGSSYCGAGERLIADSSELAAPVSSRRRFLSNEAASVPISSINKV